MPSHVAYSRTKRWCAARTVSPAASVLDAINPDSLHAFDRDARVHATKLAARLGLNALLSLNFLPRSLDTLPDALSSLLDAGVAAGIPARKLLLEVTRRRDHP